MEKHIENLYWDFSWIVISLTVAYNLIISGFLESALTISESFGLVSAFIAGMLFTSVFTTPIATVALAKFAIHGNLSLLQLAGVAALGALIGDLVLFHFIRDHVYEDLKYLADKKRLAKIERIVKMKALRWFMFFIGALIIASPLPDEMGIAIMGAVKTRTTTFIGISYLFNFLGVLLIGLAARAV